MVFPSRSGLECRVEAGCPPAVAATADALTLGLQQGRLSLPEGVPMLWSVDPSGVGQPWADCGEVR